LHPLKKEFAFLEEFAIDGNILQYEQNIMFCSSSWYNHGQTLSHDRRYPLDRLFLSYLLCFDVDVDAVSTEDSFSLLLLSISVRFLFPANVTNSSMATFYASLDIAIEVDLALSMSYQIQTLHLSVLVMPVMSS
jgi:hypothetical protein